MIASSYLTAERELLKSAAVFFAGGTGPRDR